MRLLSRFVSTLVSMWPAACGDAGGAAEPAADGTTDATSMEAGVVAPDGAWTDGAVRDSTTSALDTAVGSEARTDLEEVSESTDCAENIVPLVLAFGDDGLPDSQLVAVEVPGPNGVEAGWLTLDTGSSLTFLYGPDSASPHLVRIGCESLDVIARDFPGDIVLERPILGVLGADFFIQVPTELDYPTHRIVRHLGGSAPATDGLGRLSLAPAKGHIVGTVAVDGVDHVLMFDTGAPHALLVPMAGRPTDEATAVADINGDAIEAWLGDSEFLFAGEVHVAPTFRIPSWPYFESYAHDIHPALDGLLGLSAVGMRRLVFIPDEGALYLGPRASPSDPKPSESP